MAAIYPCSRQAAAVARGKGFAGRLDVLPLGYDSSVFTPGAQAIGGREIVLTIAGRLVPEKGALDAVRILAGVNRIRPARLIVAGEGPEEQRMVKLAADLGVQSRVESVGWQRSERLAATLRETHVVLVPSSATPSWAEQFGRIVIEAQASGATVAAYRSGSIPEVAGESALLADVGRDDELARRIVELVADGAAFDEMRRRGLEHAAGFTWERVAARQASLYEQVLSASIDRASLPRDLSQAALCCPRRVRADGLHARG